MLAVSVVLHGYQETGNLQAAGDTTLQGMQRHQYGVILIVAHRALPFGDKNPDHLTGKLLHTQLLPQRWRGAEEFAPQGFANEAHRRTGLQFFFTEDAARGHLPVIGDEIGVVGAGDIRRPVAAIGNHRDSGMHLGRHHFHATDLGGNRLCIHLLEGRRTRPARPLTLALTHHQQVTAQPGDLVLHRLGGAIAQRHHRDHRADTNDNAKNGQE